MATVSPTPLAINHDGVLRRPHSRQDLRRKPSRPRLKRGSPLLSMISAHDAAKPGDWKLSIGDSSDDEIPVPPMGFSAEAKAILGDEASAMENLFPPREGTTMSNSPAGGAANQVERYGLQSRIEAGSQIASPSSQLNGALRIIRLGPTDSGSRKLKRAATTSSTNGSPAQRDSQNLVTPAPRPRSVQSFEPRDHDGSPRVNMEEIGTAKPKAMFIQPPMEPQTVLKGDGAAAHEVATQLGNLSITRIKHDDTGLHGSLRIKRVGKVTGRYLSGPARRGMKRRQSEEDQSPMPEDLPHSGDRLNIYVAREDFPSKSFAPDLAVPLINSPAEDHAIPNPEHQAHQGRQQTNINLMDENPIEEGLGQPNPNDEPKPSLRPTPVLSPAPTSAQVHEEPVQPVFKVPPLPPLPSRFDQENEPPPTFRRNKPNSTAMPVKGRGFSVMNDQKMLAYTPETVSPKRPALAPRSQNTPMRPAPPPPPKMTVLETATAPAGSASASQARKKRNYISVNGKLFTRMDCIGRGGSSKVYRVMAENYKVFALKRVTLEDQDENAIRGYKGEIDLLKKLENVERVVRLFDWELNDERQTLSVLMEMGESDLNRVLTQRLNADEAIFDVTFTRYFWKEMLECVQSVHRHDIVHSDLKPANFLLLQGKLKLIDFGISNAIQDNTINVHREQHIGTPNYMSPEALVDSNAASGLPANVGKLMKLGKPSDVWSLGCILYQMVYGKPPFAHIANQMQRIMAIPNSNHVINFPTSGVGGVPLSSGLIKTLRRCLNRDPTQRPTVEELLGPADPFLDPDSPLQGTVPVGQELIARLQHNIVKHIREKGMPTDTELAGWPARFFVSIKAAVEEGRA